MVLRTVPMKTDVRLASTLERQHMKVQIDENDPHFQNMCKLLDLTRKPKFDYAAYEDEALKLRQQAVDRIMAGIDPEPQPEEDSDPGEALDQLEATLSQLMEA